jgi:Raf kinase inhibitor-like YbhB/YbcL family protein
MPSKGKAPTIALRIESPDFRSGQRIPTRHASKPEGENVPPQLKWSGTPSATKEFALLVEDPDASGEKPFAHWVAWGIPGTATGVSISSQFVEGRNDFGYRGWGGPRPPEGSGDHHYHFRVYALDASANLSAGAGREELLSAIKSHVLAEGELVGIYSR